MGRSAGSIDASIKDKRAIQRRGTDAEAQPCSKPGLRLRSCAMADRLAATRCEHKRCRRDRPRTPPGIQCQLPTQDASRRVEFGHHSPQHLRCLGTSQCWRLVVSLNISRTNRKRKRLPRHANLVGTRRRHTDKRHTTMTDDDRNSQPAEAIKRDLTMIADLRKKLLKQSEGNDFRPTHHSPRPAARPAQRARRARRHLTTQPWSLACARIRRRINASRFSTPR